MHKSRVSNIFSQFKKNVEKRYETKIKNLYFDNSGEHVALKNIYPFIPSFITLLLLIFHDKMASLNINIVTLLKLI